MHWYIYCTVIALATNKIWRGTKRNPIARGFSYFFLCSSPNFCCCCWQKIDSLTAERVCECGLVDILLLHCCCNCNSSAKSLISFRPAARESPTQTPKSRLCFLWLLHSQFQAILWGFQGSRVHCLSLELLTHLMKFFLVWKELLVRQTKV